MKKVIFPALIFSLWMSLLATDIPVNSGFLPAMGRFMSPFHGIWQSVESGESTYSMQGKVIDEVRILFDERDIPHIYATTLEDAMYAQGYLHAANRLFSMDISIRAAAGRLSEMIGQRTILLDRKAREKGFEYSASRKVIAWTKDPETKALLDAYTAGINAYVNSLEYKDWPYEYKVLSHAPEEWTLQHTALAMTNMAIALCLREDDLATTAAQNHLSAEDYMFLFPDHNPKESPVIPSEKEWDFIPVSPPAPGKDIRPVKEHKEELDARKVPLNGSNNWAVSGSKTANGVPILANDPHLKLTLPNIWYELEMHTPEMSVHGVSVPGIPSMLLGFNEYLAWGSTNSGQDVLDWYEIKWENTARQNYLLDGQYVQAEMRTETIEIRGAHPITDTIRYTVFGPVAHLDEYRDLAMKWAGHALSNQNDALTFLGMNRAKNKEEFLAASKSLAYPVQNFVFATVQGDIGISVTGDIPIRPFGYGERLAPGTEKANNWQGFIPESHAPQIINPKRQFVSSANQAPADSTYPYPLLGKRTFEDYRGRMINLLLDSMDNVSAEDIRLLQQNNFGLLGSEILPVILQSANQSGCLTGEEAEVARLLARWNYEYHRDSISPIYFDLLFDAIEKLTWDELMTSDIMLPEEWRLIEIATNHPEHIYFDRVSTPNEKESFHDIVCMAFSEMMKAYHNLEGNRSENWGQYKGSTIPHIARFNGFGLDTLVTSGGRHIINTMKQSHGPSWRMVVELSEPPKAWVNYPGGQSGDPASRFYRDMVGDFFEGKYYEVALRKSPDDWAPRRHINILP